MFFPPGTRTARHYTMPLQSIAVTGELALLIVEILPTELTLQSSTILHTPQKPAVHEIPGSKKAYIANVFPTRIQCLTYATFWGLDQIKIWVDFKNLVYFVADSSSKTHMWKDAPFKKVIF